MRHAPGPARGGCTSDLPNANIITTADRPPANPPKQLSATLHTWLRYISLLVYAFLAWASSSPDPVAAPAAGSGWAGATAAAPGTAGPAAAKGGAASCSCDPCRERVPMPVLERPGCAGLRRELGGRRAAVPAAVKAVGLAAACCLAAKTPCCGTAAGCCTCCWWFSCIGSKAGIAAAAAAAAAPAAPQLLACAGCWGETLCERERGRMRAAGLPAGAAVPNTKAPAPAGWSAAAALDVPAVLSAGKAAVLPSDADEDWAANCDAPAAAAGAAAAAEKARGLVLAPPGLLLGEWRLNAARPAWALGAEAAAPNTKLNGAGRPGGGGAAVCWCVAGRGSPWGPAGGCKPSLCCAASAPPRLSRLSRARRSAATESAGLWLAAAAAALGAAPEVGVAEPGTSGVAAEAPPVDEG